MKLRWLVFLVFVLSLALITACDTKQTAVVFLEEQANDGKTWSYTMEPDYILVQKDVTLSEAEAKKTDYRQWKFRGAAPGIVKLCFTYSDGTASKRNPYVYYDYRVEEDRSVTVLGISGNALPRTLPS